MTNSPILNQIYWKKGLVKLVQFVEEGLDIGKIKRDDKREKSRAQFIIDYIMANFRPDPNIPNQKLTHYTEYRIKKAQNDRYSQDIDGREFFIFDKTDTN